MDPGLQFWLHYVDDRGGLSEPARDGTLVVLPPAVAAEFELPDELVVTVNPDAAREDGVTLLAAGHPVLIRAADEALAGGDAGVIALQAPVSPPPGTALLQEKARDQFPVEHGRIDVTDLPVRIVRPVLRVGALVTYAVSAEECFQERMECWVDAVSGRQLGTDAVALLKRAPRREAPEPADRSVLDTVRGTLDEAHRILDTAAARRRATLSSQALDAHQRERERARAYYDDALHSIERRRASADTDRAELLGARAASTREERARRLLEIDEKYQARHDIRPFRLHVFLVPGWRVHVDVRRGDRRYPLTLDWLSPIGAYADLRCPHCGEPAPLSASKIRLGCLTCLPSSTLHSVPSPETA
ncbi:MAG: hypothetical protein ACRDRZ_04900 [Pseudonocardiaceae bacterium]